MGVLAALKKLYDEIGFDEPHIYDDIENDYVTENKCRNGREVLWYTDESHNIAIYIDTLEFLSEEEIDEQLC